MSRDYNLTAELALFCKPEIFPGDHIRLIARGALINVGNVETVIDNCIRAVDVAFLNAGYEVAEPKAKSQELKAGPA